MNAPGQPVKKARQRFLLFRFLGATLVPAVLLCVSLSFGMLNVREQFLFIEKEISGIQAVHSLFNALLDLQKIRGLSNIIPWNETDDLLRQRQALMQAFQYHFKTPEWKQLSDTFNLDHDVARIISEVQNLYDFKDNSLTEGETFKRYTALIENINSTILLVAERSNLILDSELDTYYLIEISVKQLPDLCEAFASVRGMGSGMIAQGNCTEKETELFQEKISIIRDQLRKLTRIKTIISDVTLGIELFFESDLGKANQQFSSFLQICESLAEHTYSLSAITFFQQGTGVIDVLAKTFNTTAVILEERLDERLTHHLRLLFMTVFASILTVAAIFYFSLSFYRLQKESYRELEQFSITDPLTSIHNRRYLDMIYDNELQRSRRDGMGVAFGLLDVDHFKAFNDTYGHHEGDIALRQVAYVLKRSLQRAGDFCFRFGGEEFCFLFRASSLMETKIIGERIRVAIEQLEIEHRENTACPHVTVSLGIAFLPRASSESLDYMIKQADKLLYEAKDNGRNQCIALALNP